MTHLELQQHKDHQGEHDSPASVSVGEVVSDLWDEFWFFQNCLTDGRPKVKLSFNPTPQTPSSPLAKVTSSGSSGGLVITPVSPQQPLTRHQSLSRPAATHPAPARPSLQKAPSLPPDIGNYSQQEQDEDQAPASDSHKQTRKKLQRSYSSMQDAASCPRQHSSCKPWITPSRSHRPPRDFMLEAHWIAPNKTSYRHNCRQSAITSSMSRVTFQVKKWKSLTDLEHEEVQGFKDLGFRFDDTGGQLSPVLLKMIPGLRSGTSSPDGDGDGDGSTPKEVSRPYLSEAWLMQQSAPPVLTWDGRGVRSPAHMKEKLRFWARAVASNIRQEC